MCSGWTSNIQILFDILKSVELMTDGSKTFNEKMPTVILILVKWWPADVLYTLRLRLQVIHEARFGALEQVRYGEIWHFDRIRERKRKRIIGDIIDLYESCLLDVHKLESEEFDIIYPLNRIYKDDHT